MKRAAVPLLLACSLLLLGPAACPKQPLDFNPSGSAAAPGVANPQLIRDERLGVTLVAPETWKVTRRDGNPVLYAEAPGAGLYGPMANLVVEAITQRLDPFDYLQANILTLRLSLPGLEVKEGGVEVAGRGSTAWLHYTYPRRETKVEALAYCQTDNYRAYVVTCIAPAAEFKASEPVFRAIGRSLRLD